MAGLFKQPKTFGQTTVSTALRVSAAVQGSPIPIGCGQTRWAPILIDWEGFSASPAKSPGSKGGVLGAGGKGNTGEYDYAVSGIMLLGEGPITEIVTIYNGTVIVFLTQ